MLELMAHRGPDGLCYQKFDCVGFASAELSMDSPGKSNSPQCLVRNIFIVADARLYNRKELLVKARDAKWKNGEMSDAELLLACYIALGERMLAYLDGDFAFVIWDGRKRRIFAARDPFGAKPLFFYNDCERFIFASEPKQILAMPAVPVTPNSLVIGEFLAQRFQDVTQTFFRSIWRLRPGYYLNGSARGYCEKRYWEPALVERRQFSSTEMYIERFRDLLKNAVSKRIDTTCAVGAHLSGGLDSTSIVLLASELYKERGSGLPPFATVSAAYVGMACDESLAIDAVAERTPFDNAIFNPIGDPLIPRLETVMYQSDRPFADRGEGTFVRTKEKLSSMGARTLLMGFGGDELLTEGHFLRDLAVRGHYWRLLKEAFELDRVNASYWTLTKLLTDSIGSQAPAFLKSLYWRFKKQPSWQIASVLTDSFLQEYQTFPAVDRETPKQFSSLVQLTSFQDLTHPYVPWLFELYEAKGAYCGYEVRCPFLDRPLAEFVLSIPLLQRLTGDKWKTLIRRAMRDQLPPPVYECRKKGDLNEYVIRCVLDEKKKLKEMVFSSAQLASSPYIDRSKLLKLFNADVADFNEPMDYINKLWNASCLELWLANMPKYSEAQLKQ
jgi:asparagine synthase (glutamine-hydrolysing)